MNRITSKDELSIGIKVKVVNMNLSPKERKNPMKGKITSMSEKFFNVHNGKYQESFAYRDLNITKGIVVTRL